MGTTALIFIQEGSVGIIFINMKCFILSSLLSLSLAAPAPEAEAALGYPLLAHHVAPFAVVPARQLQWPGLSVPGVDSTCFGCRASVVVPVGRRRREAEADAEAEAEADAYYGAYPAISSLNGYAHNLGSGNSFAAISSGLPYVPHAYGAAAYGYPYLG